MGKDNNNNNGKGNGNGNDYYYDYYQDGFHGYQATTINPGLGLLFITLGYCILCFILALNLTSKRREQKQEEQSDEDDKNDDLQVSTRHGLHGKKRFGGNSTLLAFLSENAFKRKKKNNTVVRNRVRIKTLNEFGYFDGKIMNSGIGDDNSTIATPHSLMKTVNVMDNSLETLTLDDETLETKEDGRLEFEDLIQWELVNGMDPCGILNGESTCGQRTDHKSTSNKSTSTATTKSFTTNIDNSTTDGTTTTGPHKARRMFSCLRCVFNPNVYSNKKRHKNKSNTVNLKRAPLLQEYITKNDLGDHFPGGPKNKVILVENLMDDNASTASTKRTPEEKKNLEDLSNVEKEMNEVFKLAAPWTFTELVSYCSDFFLLIIVSHTLGTDVLICYSTVWFILDVFNIISGGLYGSCYKHVNNSIANEHYFLTGEYIQLSILLNLAISIPATLAAIYFMENIFEFYGYGEDVTSMATSYAAIASLSHIMESCLGFLSIVLEIDGHAKFNAVYGFWESVISVVAESVFIITCKPSLFYLGVFHFVEALLMHLVYCYYVYIRKKWLNPYIDGLSSGSALKNTPAIITLFKRSFPLLLDSALGDVEWFVLSIFAAYQGAAEAVVLILYSYIWDIITIAPDSYAEATSSRVAHVLSTGGVNVAEALASRAMFNSTLMATALSIPLLVFRGFIVWCISIDEVLEKMLIQLLPYIAICQPFLSLGTTACALNEALCMYHHSVKRALATSFLITMPLAAIFTYYLNYNMEGLAAALSIGYVTNSVLDLNLYMNADWERAVRKNKEITEYGPEQEESEEEEEDKVSILAQNNV